MTVARSPVAEEIERELTSWEGVEAHPHRFGGVEFRIGRRELGHLHGDRFADLPFPRRIRDELIAAGRARAHHVLPDSGWVTVPMDDVPALIELFRMGYERATAAARA
jgi:luciferase-like monooxygenase